ncbi:MAG: peptidoglycan-binding protein [Oscillatoriaceae cyanobacterium Prado104]|jgi:peptidoglycan hydrolase-like protein with peptidoglycan-binding domain|nr:peptidoglycan-binding protein [Oscillatoriaceae cyanobacterium Prado104]
MSRNLTASWNEAREVPSFLLGWSLCGLLAIGLNAPIPAAAQQPAVRDTDSSSIAQVGGIVRPALKLGSRGPQVTELQAALKLLGFYTGEVDGIFSEGTAKAVSEFQQAAGIGADGIVGQDTWNRLFPESPTSAIATPAPEGATAEGLSLPSQTNLPILRRGMRGDAVRELQERLRAKGFLQSRADGVFGRQTQVAVKAVQRQYRLPADGIVGPATWEILLR